MLGTLFACVVWCRIIEGTQVPIWSAMAGSVSVAFFLLLLTWIYPGAFGLGDVKLMFVVGVHLGLGGVWNAFVIGSVTAAIVCICGLLLKKISMKSKIPFGPFLCIGIAVALILKYW